VITTGTQFQKEAIFKSIPSSFIGWVVADEDRALLEKWYTYW
jgi:hypothetical protein